MTFHLDQYPRERDVRAELDHMGQKPVTITLPTRPPSTNHLFATVGRRRVRSERYNSWRNAAGWEIQRQRPGKLTGHVSLSIELEHPGRKADASNFVKAAEDLLVELGVIEDDSLVTKVESEWTDGPGCKITVRPSEPRFKRRVA